MASFNRIQLLIILIGLFLLPQYLRAQTQLPGLGPKQQPILEPGIANTASSKTSTIIVRCRPFLKSELPLFIVDGQVFDGDINPDTIQTLKTIKGEEAVAVYGSRAVNGAVIITTKVLTATKKKSLHAEQIKKASY